MTDQRVGRHVRIYEWDEVDLDDDTSTEPELQVQSAKASPADKKSVPETQKGLSALLRKKIF